MSESAFDVVSELSRRFEAGDGAGAMALFGDDVRIEQPASLPHGGWYCGHAGVAEMGQAFGRHWARQITNPRILAAGPDGRRAVQVTTQTWTAKDTGRAATVDVVELFEVAGGRVREIRVFQQDTHLLLQTLTAGRDGQYDQ
jgi:ketosteroid isomerase-like protein